MLDRLWTTTMRIMLENAGGQRGCFVIRKDGRLVIEGQSKVGARVTMVGAIHPRRRCGECARATPVDHLPGVEHE